MTPLSVKKTIIKIIFTTLAFALTVTSVSCSQNSKKSSRWPTAFLISAVYFNNMRLFNESLANGANVNAVDEKGRTPLMNAAYHGNSEMIKILLAKGARTELEDLKGNTALDFATVECMGKVDNDWSNAQIIAQAGYSNDDIFKAALRGDAEKIKQFLQEGVSVNSRGCPRETLKKSCHSFYYNPNENIEESLLEITLNEGHAQATAVLLESGAEYDIHDAAMIGDKEFFKLYNPAIEEKILVECLYNAAKKDNVNIVKFLLDSGIASDANFIDKGETALGAAVCNGAYNSALLLLEYGANPNKNDINNITPLAFAVYFKRPRMAELLLDYGSDVNVTLVRGETPLHWVQDSETASILLEHGASLQVKDNLGKTAADINLFSYEYDIDLSLWFMEKLTIDEVRYSFFSSRGLTSETYGDKRFIKALIDKGIRSNTDATLMVKFLTGAVRLGNTDCVKLLLEYQTNPNNELILSTACEYGFVDITEMLLDYGADVNYTDTEGDTALFYAAACDQVDTADVLISHDANINQKDNLGGTAILEAITRDNIDTMELLLRHGARIDYKIKKGKFAGMTPVDVAEKYSSEETVKFLKTWISEN